MQCPHHLFLVDPRDFSFNAETAGSNLFQQSAKIENVKEKVVKEFYAVLEALKKKDISFTVVDSPKGVQVPDAVFPNNWFAVLPSGELILFPMHAPNRRAEVNEILIGKIKSLFNISRIIDLRLYLNENRFLEGTGSIVFDHDNKLAYACQSPRTDIGLLSILCKEIGYTPVSFLAVDLKGNPIYHTNVVMSVGTKLVIICLEAVHDLLERAMLKQTIEKSGKKLVELSYYQMNLFSGNILEVLNGSGKPVWLLSETAISGYTYEQINELGGKDSAVYVKIPTIETIGGGSLRCMLAGIHAPFK
jgi:hypothetical protein